MRDLVKRARGEIYNPMGVIISREKELKDRVAGERPARGQLFLYKGKWLSAHQLSKLPECAVPYKTLYNRLIRYGWQGDIENAVITPPKKKPRI